MYPIDCDRPNYTDCPAFILVVVLSWRFAQQKTSSKLKFRVIPMKLRALSIYQQTPDTTFRLSRPFFGIKEELICGNDERDSGRKFVSPEFCFPFAQTVNQPVFPMESALKKIFLVFSRLFSFPLSMWLSRLTAAVLWWAKTGRNKQIVRGDYLNSYPRPFGEMVLLP